jgi:hypothetical protein
MKAAAGASRAITMASAAPPDLRFAISIPSPI